MQAAARSSPPGPLLQWRPKLAPPPWHCACTAAWPPPPLTQVELLSEGDSCNELFVVVSGSLASYRSSAYFHSEVGPFKIWVSPCVCQPVLEFTARFSV